MKTSDAQNDWFELAAQIGGKDGFAVLRPEIVLLKKLLKNAKGPFSPTILQFSFILRVDGNVREWSFSGLAHLDLNLKDQYVSIDLAVPKSIWSNDDRLTLKQHLATGLSDGLEQMLAALRQRQIECNEKLARSELSAALKGYVERDNP